MAPPPLAIEYWTTGLGSSWVHPNFTLALEGAHVLDELGLPLGGELRLELQLDLGHAQHLAQHRLGRVEVLVVLAQLLGEREPRLERPGVGRVGV